MKSIAVIAFTQAGCKLAQGIAAELSSSGDARVSVCATKRVAELAGVDPAESLGSWTPAHFDVDDALVFVGATGIAVRAIAPHVRDKFSDPAVVVVDERGSFAVSLLSGHVGGANTLARRIAQATGGQAVVGTATDVNGLFAVDEWARELGMAIVERTVAKEISAALLEGKTVGFASDFPVEGALPAGVVAMRATGAHDAAAADAADAEGAAQASVNVPELGFCVTWNLESNPFPRTLHLVPKTAVVGAGCRRDTATEVLWGAIQTTLSQAGVPLQAVGCIASIDVKSDERAFHEISSEQGIRLRFLTAEQLNSVPGEFVESEFVRKTVGVGNVCERAAAWPDNKRLVSKQAGGGVTVAIAQKEFTVSFPREAAETR